MVLWILAWFFGFTNVVPWMVPWFFGYKRGFLGIVETVMRPFLDVLCEFRTTRRPATAPTKTSGPECVGVGVGVGVGVVVGVCVCVCVCV